MSPLTFHLRAVTLLCFLIGHVYGQNLFFPNTTLGPGAQNFSQACVSALVAPINCDASLSNITLQNVSPSNATRKALCTTACAQSLAAYVKGTSQSCNISQNVDGVPPAAFGGMAYSIYNQTCLKDTTTGAWCTDFLAGYTTTTDSDGSSLPKSLICSNCATNLFIGLQGSQYSTYDAQFADQWTSIQSQCGTKYNTSIPNSPFPAPPSVTANKTLVCPASQQYTVQSGDNCNAIASKHNVASRQIVAINNLANDCSNLIAGVPICLPPSTCTTYTVKAGDTCTSIVNGTSMNSISQLLGINPGLYCQSLLSSEIICISPPGGQYNGTTVAGATATQTAVFATATASPPSTVPYGTTMSCGKWYEVQQYDTCQIILVASQISLDLFLAINPSVNANCTNLSINFSYCILPTANWQSSTGNGTTTTVAPPGPTPSGTTHSCYSWHTIASGDNCQNLEVEFGITMQQLQYWNPQLNNNCTNLLLGDAYCVDGPANTGTTVQSTVPPPTTTPTGTTNACYVWHTIVSGDTCYNIEQNYTITMAQLQAWNPQLKSDCSNLLLGDAYCVSGPATTATTTSSTAPSTHTTVPPPTATPSGTTNSCYAWHTIVSGDTCYNIEQTFNITMTQFQTWNPSLKSDCSNLLLGDAYCVQGPSTASKRAVVVEPRVLVEESRGGYPIGWPYPIRY